MWTTSTGWWGDYTDDDAIALLRDARAQGINFFDASDSYGNGRAEEQLGRAFGNDPDVVIATKVGYDFYTHGDERRGQQEIPQDFRPAYIRKACDESLRRLQRDRIDFYQLHNPKMDTIDRDETFACLDDLVARRQSPRVRRRARPRHRLGGRRRGAPRRAREHRRHADHLQHAGAGSRPRAHRRVPRQREPA